MSLFPMYDETRNYSGMMQAVAAARKPITGTLTAVADLPVSKHTAMQLILLGGAREIRKFLRWNDKPIPALHASSLGAVLTKGPMFKHEKGGRGIAP